MVSSKRSTLRDLLILIILALLVYLPGFTWGIPHTTGDDRVHSWANDDLVPLAPLAEMHNTFFNTKPDRNYSYPWFHYFLLASADAPYLAYVYLSGGVDLPGLGYPVYPFGLNDPVGVFYNLSLIGRGVSLILALAAISGAYLTGRAMWNRAAGFVAALFTMLMFPMTYLARLGNLDVPVLAWTSLGLAAFTLCLRHGWTVKRGVWFGVFVALAMATKDQATGSFLLLPLVLIPLHFKRHEPSKLFRWNSIWAAPLATMIAFLVVYILASGIPVDPQRFVIHFQKTIFVGTTRDLYLRHPASPAGYLQQLGDIFGYLVDVMSWPVLIFSLIGITLAIFKDRLSLALLLSSLGFILMLLPVGLTRIHYLLPVALPLMAYAGYAVSSGMGGRRAVKIVTVIALLVALGYQLMLTLDLDHDMLRDSRYQASTWLGEQLRSGDKLLYFGFGHKLPALSQDIKSIRIDRMQDALPKIESEQPEAILITPQDINEDRQRVEWRYGPHSVLSPQVSEELFQRLVDGSLGYRLVAQFQSPRLFPWLNRPFLTYPTVNPPVLIFLRLDRAGDMPGLDPWKTAPHYPKFVRVHELTVDTSTGSGGGD